MQCRAAISVRCSQCSAWLRDMLRLPHSIYTLLELAWHAMSVTRCTPVQEASGLVMGRPSQQIGRRAECQLYHPGRGPAASRAPHTARISTLHMSAARCDQTSYSGLESAATLLVCRCPQSGSRLIVSHLEGGAEFVGAGGVAGAAQGPHLELIGILLVDGHAALLGCRATYDLHWASLRRSRTQISRRSRNLNCIRGPGWHNTAD